MFAPSLASTACSYFAPGDACLMSAAGRGTTCLCFNVLYSFMFVIASGCSRSSMGDCRLGVMGYYSSVQCAC